MNLQQRDEACIWHPYTAQKNNAPIIPIVKGKGTLLYTENNTTYIDAISSWWVTIHGHAHPEIAKRIFEQAQILEQVIFAGFTHKPAIELAERLVKMLPGQMAKIFYSDNGSTATEVAIKMSIQYWWNQGQVQRNKILAFKNGYHGDTFGAMSISDRSVFTIAYRDKLFEVIFIDTPTPANLNELTNFLQNEGEDIAAFIYEPLLQGAGGMKMYETYLLNELLNVAKHQSIVCIADEVLTGFGRTGKFFASDHVYTKPDIMCLSKGLTGGTMALGVTACTKNIHDAFVSDDKMKTFFHGHSFTANPLACTAALASLDLLETVECIQKIGWLAKMNKAFSYDLERLNGIKNVRVLGTILAFEIDTGSDEYLNNISREITAFCLQQGVYLRPLGNTVYIMPPYCITETEYGQVQQTILNWIALNNQ